jgi:hypothetical protein
MKTTKAERKQTLLLLQGIGPNPCYWEKILLEYEELESRLEEATRLLERCFYWVRDNHAMPSYSELLSDLEAFNKGGPDVP